MNASTVGADGDKAQFPRGLEADLAAINSKARLIELDGLERAVIINPVYGAAINFAQG